MNPLVDTYICVYEVPLKLKAGMVWALDTASSKVPKSIPKAVVTAQSDVPPVISV